MEFQMPMGQKVSRLLGTSSKILVVNTKFLVALATSQSQFRTLYVLQTGPDLRHTIIGHLHLCQLSQIICRSSLPEGYGLNLLIYQTDHQISWIQRKGLILADVWPFL